MRPPFFFIHSSFHSSPRILHPGSTPSQTRSLGRGFTLLELLLVIGILGILGGITFVALNPQELIAEARDTTRLTDLRTINGALFTFTTQMGDPGGNPNYVYLSLPDADSHCASYTLPVLPVPYEYSCSTSANYRKVDGTGWIPVNLSSMPGGSPTPTLPIDPQNSSSRYYSYLTGGSYEVLSLLESEKYLKSSASKDKGSDPGRIELGTDLSLWKTPSGLVGYWPFDEGSGTTAYDYSGNNYHGTLAGTLPTWETGQVGSALRFSGSSVVNLILSGAQLNSFTVIMWIKPFTPVNYFGGLFQEWPNDGEVQMVNTGVVGVHPIYGGSLAIDNWNFISVSVQNNNAVVAIDTGHVAEGVVLSPRFRETGIGGIYNAYPGYGFNGMIDEVRLYDRALSDEEIKSLYHSTK